MLITLNDYFISFLCLVTGETNISVSELEDVTGFNVRSKSGVTFHRIGFSVGCLSRRVLPLQLVPDHIEDAAYHAPVIDPCNTVQTRKMR
jgi:hypothetical protein